MPIDSKISEAGLTLADQHRTRSLYSLEGNLMPLDIDEAYLIQREYQRHISAHQGAISGYKLALTTAAIQARNGVNEPCFGIMLLDNIRHAPSTLTANDYVQLNLECEVGVCLGSDLPAEAAPYDLPMVSEAVESLSVAFEVIDNRRFPGKEVYAQFLTSVAANAFNEGVVLGESVRDWRSLDLPGVYGSMTINGEIVGEGHGSDVMGHPLEPLAWLANQLANENIGLKAGMVVITGSIVLPKQVVAGDKASATIEGLGHVEVSIV